MKILQTLSQELVKDLFVKPRAVLILVFGVSLMPSATIAQIITTPVGSGGSCFRVCQTPLLSDIYTVNGQPFYICLANAGNQGFRPGYNLSFRDFTDRCTVGFGGRETRLTDYLCVCLGG